MSGIPALSRIVRAMLWALASAASFSTMGAMAKLVSADLHPFEVTFFRCFIGLLLVLPVVVGAASTLRTTRPSIHLMRGILSVVSMLSLFYAMANIPLAMATAILFTRPMWMLVLARLFLRERVRMDRWIAAAVGFSGVVVMVQPWQVGAVSPAFGWALMAAVSIAGVQTFIKTMSGSESAGAVVFYFALITTAATIGPAAAVWQTPNLWEISLLVVVALSGNLSQYFMVKGFRLADASAVASIDYVQLVFAATYGFLLFGEMPSAATLLGALIIVAASLYIVRREGGSPSPSVGAPDRSNI